MRQEMVVCAIKKQQKRKKWSKAHGGSGVFPKGVTPIKIKLSGWGLSGNAGIGGDAKEDTRLLEGHPPSRLESILRARCLALALRG